MLPPAVVTIGTGKGAAAAGAVHPAVFPGARYIPLAGDVAILGIGHALCGARHAAFGGLQDLQPVQWVVFRDRFFVLADFILAVVTFPSASKWDALFCRSVPQQGTVGAATGHQPPRTGVGELLLEAAVGQLTKVRLPKASRSPAFQ